MIGVVVPLLLTAIVLASGVFIYMDKNLSARQSIDRAKRIGSVSLFVAYVILLLTAPRRAWLTLLVLFALGTGYVWLISRGGHVLEDERQNALEDATRMSENKDDGPSP